MPEKACVAINGENSKAQVTFVAELAIDPLTVQADFYQSVRVESYLVNIDMVKEAM